MADRGALTEIQRLAILLEAAGTNGALRGAAGSAKNPSGISGLKVNATQDSIKSKAHTTSRKRQRTSRNGDKKYAASFYAEIGGTFQSDFDDVLTAALGAKMVDVAITSISTPATTGFTFVGGPPAPIVLADFADGSKKALPIESVIGLDALFAIQPAAAPTDISNPIDTGGALYYVDPTAQVKSFQLQSDYDSEPNGKTRIGLGCTIARLMLKVALSDILGLDCEFTGVDWLPTFDAEHPTALADAVHATNQFLSHMGVVYCQSLTPAAAVDIEAKDISFNMAPRWVDRKAITPKQPTGIKSVGSPVLSKRQASHFDDGVTLAFHYYDSGYDTLRQDPTDTANKRQIFFEFFNGAPQGTATARIAGWFPEVQIDEEPADADDGGLLGLTTKWNVMERTLTGLTTSPFYLAFFGA